MKNAHGARPASPSNSLLRTWTWKLYEHAPQATDRLIVSLQTRLEPWIRRKVGLERVWGPSPLDGGEAVVAVAYSDPSVEYFVQRLVGRHPRRETIGTVSWRELPDALTELGHDADLVLGRIGCREAARLNDPRFLCLPGAVRFHIETPGADEALPRVSKSIQSNIRRVEKSEIRWSTSTRMTDFESFYDDYYVPFVANRHAELGYIRGRESQRRAFRHGAIIWMDRNGERIGGVLMTSRGSTVTAGALGSLHGSPEPLRLGLVTAVYMAGLEYARTHGFRYYDLGFARPALRDGPLSQKRGWGGQLGPIEGVRHDLLLRWEELTPRVARFLEAVPLIFRDGERLSGIAALPMEKDGQRVQAAALNRSLSVTGLQRFLVVSLRGWDPPRGKQYARGAEQVWLAGPGTPETIVHSAFPLLGETSRG